MRLLFHKKGLKLITLLLASTIFLFACGPSGIGGTDTGNGNNNGGNNGDGGSIDIPINPDDTGKAVHELFSDYTYVTNAGNISVGIDGQNQQFNDLLSQQITILAKDIMYRLFAVYGEGSPAKSGVSSNLIDSNNRGHYYILTDEYDSPITYNGQNAYIHNNNILSNPSGYKLVDNTPEYKLENGDIVKGANLDLNDIASYSYTYSSKDYKISYAEDALLNNYFNLSKSINGEKIWSENDLTFIINNQYPQLSWKFGYDNSLNGELAMYNNFLDSNYQLEMFEQAIANILMGNNSYYEYDKISALENINHLGYLKYDREEIIKYVKNEIIGSDALSLDLMFKSEILDTTVLPTITGDAHNYKAYDIIIPAIMEQSFKLAFGGNFIDNLQYYSNNQPVKVDGSYVYYELDDLPNSYNNAVTLYPKMARATRNSVPILESNGDNGYDIQMSGYNYINSIVLNPKDKTGVVSLIMFISAEEDVEVEFEVNVKYVVDGVVFLNDAVSSETNISSADKKIMKIKGEYPDSMKEYEIPYSFDLNISGALDAKKQNNKYVSVDGNTTLDNYPILNAGRVGNENFDLIDNPFKIIQRRVDGQIITTMNYDAGQNYIMVSINVLNAWRIVGSSRTEIIDKVVLFNIGFTDPIFI